MSKVLRVDYDAFREGRAQGFTALMNALRRAADGGSAPTTKVASQGPPIDKVAALEVSFSRKNGAFPINVRPLQEVFAKFFEYRPSLAPVINVYSAYDSATTAENILLESVFKGQRGNLVQHGSYGGVYVKTCSTPEQVQETVRAAAQKDSSGSILLIRYVGKIDFDEEGQADQSEWVGVGEAVSALGTAGKRLVILSTIRLAPLYEVAPTREVNFDEFIKKSDVCLSHMALKDPTTGQASLLERFVQKSGILNTDPDISPEKKLNVFDKHFGQGEDKWLTHQDFIAELQSNLNLSGGAGATHTNVALMQVYEAMLDSVEPQERNGKVVQALNMGSVRKWLKKAAKDAGETEDKGWETMGPEEFVDPKLYTYYSKAASDLAEYVVEIATAGEGRNTGLDVRKGRYSSQQLANLEGVVGANAAVRERNKKRRSMGLVAEDEFAVPELAGKTKFRDPSMDATIQTIQNDSLSKNFMFLWGPPGIGKTFIAGALGALAHRANPHDHWKVAIVDLGKSKSEYHNKSLRNISRVLGEIENSKNMIIVLDEFANFFTGESSADVNKSIIGEYQAIGSMLQTWISTKKGKLAANKVFIIATGNLVHMDKFPSAMRSRFGHVVMGDPVPWDWPAYADQINARWFARTPSESSGDFGKSYFEWCEENPYWRNVPTEVTLDVDASQFSEGELKVMHIIESAAFDIMREDAVHNTSPDVLKQGLFHMTDMYAYDPGEDRGRPVYVGMNGRKLADNMDALFASVKTNWDHYAPEEDPEAYEGATPAELKRVLRTTMLQTWQDYAHQMSPAQKERTPTTATDPYDKEMWGDPNKRFLDAAVPRIFDPARPQFRGVELPDPASMRHVSRGMTQTGSPSDDGSPLGSAEIELDAEAFNNPTVRSQAILSAIEGQKRKSR